MMKDYTQKRLLELLPEVQPIIQKLLDLGYANKLDVQISCAYRSPEAQDALYQIGRTKPGKIVTCARGGESNHQKKIAVDLFYLDAQGNATFNMADYRTLWGLAKKAGLDKEGLSWSQNWVGFKESCHFEVKV